MLLLAVLPIMAACASHAAAPLLVPNKTSIPAPKTILFVGNSFSYYNKGFYFHFRNLAMASPLKRVFNFKIITKGGGRLSDYEGALNESLASNQWDAVVLQPHGWETLQSGERGAVLFQRMAKQYVAAIRNAGAKPVFFMTWAYRDVPDRTADLADAYTKIGNELDALVVPVGLAFERAAKEDPELQLILRDQIHPTVAGTYLTACTFYAAVYGESPEGIFYFSELPKEQAHFLQRIAWETVKAYYRKGQPEAQAPR